MTSRRGLLQGLAALAAAPVLPAVTPEPAGFAYWGEKTLRHVAPRGGYLREIIRVGNRYPLGAYTDRTPLAPRAFTRVTAVEAPPRTYRVKIDLVTGAGVYYEV